MILSLSQACGYGVANELQNDTVWEALVFLSMWCKLNCKILVQKIYDVGLYFFLCPRYNIIKITFKNNECDALINNTEIIIA